MPKIKYYIDNEIVRTIPEYLHSYFKKVKNGYQLRNVGIVIGREEGAVFLPKNVNRKEITTRDIKNLMKLLIEFQREEQHAGTLTEEQVYIHTNDFFLVIYELILDFQTNGLYVKRETQHKKKDFGKINWSKTITKVSPSIVGEELHYLELVRSQKVIFEDELSYIHGKTMEQISKEYGELFSSFHYFYRGRNYKMSPSQMIAYLRKRLRVENVSRTKRLIQNLLIYLGEGNVEETAMLVTEEFHMIWEKMVAEVWKHKEILKQHIAQAQWDITINGYKINGKNTQIPDVITVEDGTVNILDAKYYDLSGVMSSNTRVPVEWYSVVKQYFYDFSYDYQKAGMVKGENYFILPSYQKNCDVALYERVGDVQIQLPRHGTHTIVVLLVPMFTLIESYLVF